MVKKLALSLACLSMLTATAQAAGTAARQAAPTAGKQAGARATHGQTKSRQAIAVQRRTTRSGERIFSVSPIAAEAAQTSKAAREPITMASQDPFVGFSPSGTSLVGVGLWRMRKAEAIDPNRTNPLRDARGKTTKAAAVGMKLNF